jgi:hypothetical protein
MSSPNCDLKNAYERLARAFEQLDRQHELILNLRADWRDTNDAEAVFRTMRRTLEIYEEDRRQIEDEVIDAKAGAAFGR